PGEQVLDRGGGDGGGHRVLLVTVGRDGVERADAAGALTAGGMVIAGGVAVEDGVSRAVIVVALRCGRRSPRSARGGCRPASKCRPCGGATRRIPLRAAA